MIALLCSLFLHGVNAETGNAEENDRCTSGALSLKYDQGSLAVL